MDIFQLNVSKNTPNVGRQPHFGISRGLHFITYLMRMIIATRWMVVGVYEITKLLVQGTVEV